MTGKAEQSEPSEYSRSRLEAEARGAATHFRGRLDAEMTLVPCFAAADYGAT